VKEIVICEIDKDVIEVSKKFLPTLACGYDDPRVSVKVSAQIKILCLHYCFPTTFFVYKPDSMTMLSYR
jgi:hypothetical protein